MVCLSGPDEALVNMMVKDLQPFSFMDDCGFKEFVALLDPTCTPPSRWALKNMRYKEVIQWVEAQSLTVAMWASINMDAYLAVTCHYVELSVKLATVLLGACCFSLLQ